MYKGIKQIKNAASQLGMANIWLEAINVVTFCTKLLLDSTNLISRFGLVPVTFSSFCYTVK